jgi:hypothetical protein
LKLWYKGIARAESIDGTNRISRPLGMDLDVCAGKKMTAIAIELIAKK